MKPKPEAKKEEEEKAKAKELEEQKAKEAEEQEEQDSRMGRARKRRTPEEEKAMRDRLTAFRQKISKEQPHRLVFERKDVYQNSLATFDPRKHTDQQPKPPN